MLPITKNTSTGYNISKRGGYRPLWIVVHYFGSIGTALACSNYFKTADRQASADFFVDDDTIIQFNPDIDANYTWHCGGGLQGSIRHSKYGICKNCNSIGIEMRPYNDRGNVKEAQNAGWYFHEATVRNTADLVRYLMDKYAIPADHVIMHADVTGKYCPAPFLDRPAEWDAFRAMITNITPTPAPQPSGQMYRLRKSWTDAASQIGAWSNLDYAKAAADKHPGYTVYDASGNAVYPQGSYIVRVTVNDLRIRKTPSTGGVFVRYIEPGKYTIVETVAAGGYTWGRLKSGIGWIALDYTERV